MATYKSEALSQRYSRKVRPRSHYALGQLPRWARLTPPRLANAVLRSRTVARLAKSAAGVDQRRSLPRFSEQPLRRAARTPLPANVDVWIWADSFTDRFAADTGRAAIALLESMGLRAAVIPEPACCGLTWITTGQLTAARRIVGKAVETLHPYVASGKPVIGLEPSCLAALREDAGQLVDGPMVAEVSAGVRSLAEFLADPRRRRRAGPRPTSPASRWSRSRTATTTPSSAGRPTPPCWPARGRRSPGWAAAAAWPATSGWSRATTRSRWPSRSTTCCPPYGMPGPGAVVLADGFSCRTQLDDLVGVRAVHLAQLLHPRFAPAAGAR